MVLKFNLFMFGNGLGFSLGVKGLMWFHLVRVGILIYFFHCLVEIWNLFVKIWLQILVFKIGRIDE
jgi:hypothetical protein